MEPELIVDCRCHTGENPLWHPLEHCPYWTDIPKGEIYCYSPETNGTEPAFEGDPVGGFTIQPDGSLLLFMVQGAVALISLRVEIRGIPEFHSRVGV